MAVNIVNPIQAMENMMQQAEAAKSSGGKAYASNTIVMIADGQRAVVRPLYNMDQAIIRRMHDKFKNTDMRLSSRKDQYGNMVAAPISALCAEQFGNACMFCPDAKANKLEAYDEAFVPVFLFKLEQETVRGNNQWVPVTYTPKEGEPKPVRGFRMLRLKRSSEILKVLMQTYKDVDYQCDISACDFSIIRTGTQLNTTYTCTPKPPREMEAKLREAIPAREIFEQKLLDCYEPKILIADVAPITITPIQQAPVYVAANVQAGAATLAPLKAQVQTDMAPTDDSFEF